MPDQAPLAPDGCVYGPWYWDDAYGLSGWYCYSPDSGDVSLWRWVDLTAHGLSADWVPWNTMVHPAGPELLRLAKENAELRASQPSEEDRGWQDQEQEQGTEADGVEWKIDAIRAKIGNSEAYIWYDSATKMHPWIVTIDDDEDAGDSGAERTLMQARRQAVDAARRLRGDHD